jgi:response regulator RpfG family c-di-GMP phosphodiesterase
MDSNTLQDFIPTTDSQPTKFSVLLAGKNLDELKAIREALLLANIDVQHVGSFAEAEELWLQHRPHAVLLDVDHQESVAQALLAATQIKRHKPRQFLAYLADPILRSSGLAGDAIFARDMRTLPDALVRCLEQELV